MAINGDMITLNTKHNLIIFLFVLLHNSKEGHLSFSENTGGYYTFTVKLETEKLMGIVYTFSMSLRLANLTIGQFNDFQKEMPKIVIAES